MEQISHHENSSTHQFSMFTYIYKVKNIFSWNEVLRRIMRTNQQVWFINYDSKISSNIFLKNVNKQITRLAIRILLL